MVSPDSAKAYLDALRTTVAKRGFNTLDAELVRAFNLDDVEELNQEPPLVLGPQQQLLLYLEGLKTYFHYFRKSTIDNLKADATDLFGQQVRSFFVVPGEGLQARLGITPKKLSLETVADPNSIEILLRLIGELEQRTLKGTDDDPPPADEVDAQPQSRNSGRSQI